MKVILCIQNIIQCIYPLVNLICQKSVSSSVSLKYNLIMIHFVFQEEDIKREADLVLSDVTAKKAEAKKMLSFLNSLSKLRSSRALNVSAGKSVSETENMAFNEIIGRHNYYFIHTLEVFLRVICIHFELVHSSGFFKNEFHSIVFNFYICGNRLMLRKIIYSLQKNDKKIKPAI